MAVFDRHGNEVSSTNKCSHSDLRKAEDAIHEYRNSNDGYEDGRHGNKEQYADLQGARASSADSELQQRGFRHVDTFKSGHSSYSIWYNRHTDQCLQMAIADGRADSIVDIKSHAKCH